MIVHLYLYEPRALNGGTMRLRSALEGSSQLDDFAYYWWDAAAGVWNGPETDAPLSAPGDGPAHAAFNSTSLKRRLFPSTLWESGRRGVAAARPLVRELARRDTRAIVLHTTYLASLVSECRRAGIPTLVDLHDLVWLVHAEDALKASRGARVLRAAYAAYVSLREIDALGRADGLVTAGWSDRDVVARQTSRDVAWVPVGLAAIDVGSPTRAGCRIGLIGDFAHSATMIAARRLLTSPLARDPSVEVVFAGAGSTALASSGATTLGRVASSESFYDAVDIVVVPVANGSGMKCKVGEAVLAGRRVITTSAGVVGYPPELRHAFNVVDNIDELGRGDLDLMGERSAVDLEEWRARFLAVVGEDAAARGYATSLAAITLNG
ncbi:MAG: glycosyltransferase [Solirubrobacteraceae bacterium]